MPKIAEKLQEAGYKIDGPMPHGDGSLHLYVSDPDNHAIEFWGWREGQRAVARGQEPESVVLPV